jgi:hypothetical protein
LFTLPEKFCSFESKHPARAPFHTLAAGQAVRIDHGLSKPDIATNVNVDGAIKCANTTLYTAPWFRNDVAAGKNFAVARLEMTFFIRHGYFPLGEYAMIHVNHINNNRKTIYLP